MNPENKPSQETDPKIAVKEYVRREAGVQNVPVDAPENPDHAHKPDGKDGESREHAADRGARNQDCGEHEDDKS